MAKSGVEYLAQHPGWKTKPRTTKVRFWSLLSGKELYADQWKAWEELCRQHGTDGATVLGLLSRAYESARRNN